MQGDSMVERRKHKRYPMPRGTFVIFRNKLDPLRNHTKMSIGEIAMVLYKSDSEIMGQVTELSLGGIGFDSDYCDIKNGDNVELDLLMTEKGIYLHNLPYSTIPIETAGSGRKKTRDVRVNAVRFKKLDGEQKRRLHEMLSHHAGSYMAKKPLVEKQPMKVQA
jgi:hypothetical protein